MCHLTGSCNLAAIFQSRLNQQLLSELPKCINSEALQTASQMCFQLSRVTFDPRRRDKSEGKSGPRILHRQNEQTLQDDRSLLTHKNTFECESEKQLVKKRLRFVRLAAYDRGYPPFLPQQ